MTSEISSTVLEGCTGDRGRIPRRIVPIPMSSRGPSLLQRLHREVSTVKRPYLIGPCCSQQVGREQVQGGWCNMKRKVQVKNENSRESTTRRVPPCV